MRKQRSKALALLLTAAAAFTLALAASAQAGVPSISIGPNVPAVRQPATPLTQSGSATSYSYNWSGYVAGNGSEEFKSVSSSYVQAAVTCPASGAYSVFWVGLDGWYDGTVEQDGTAAYCNGSTPEYFAWWEMYPTNSIQYWFAIKAGDKISESVKYAKGTYTLAVKDKTSGAHQTLKEQCASNLTCNRSSAEWIVERPGYGGNNFAKLADWGTTSLASDKAATTGGAKSISGFSNSGIDMVSNNQTHELATVGPLGAKGNSFLDTWDAVE